VEFVKVLFGQRLETVANYMLATDSMRVGIVSLPSRIIPRGKSDTEKKISEVYKTSEI
jgi:hypothetical protein